MLRLEAGEDGVEKIYPSIMETRPCTQDAPWHVSTQKTLSPR
ncbi:MAG: hypothetical protein RID09_10870 [Coleofasciculus sp. G1-WW12-02]